MEACVFAVRAFGDCIRAELGVGVSSPSREFCWPGLLPPLQEPLASAHEPLEGGLRGLLEQRDSQLPPSQVSFLDREAPVSPGKQGGMDTAVS